MKQRKLHISLNEHPNIIPEVRAQVKKLAGERDYRPNPFAIGVLRQ